MSGSASAVALKQCGENVPIAGDYVRRESDRREGGLRVVAFHADEFHRLKYIRLSKCASFLLLQKDMLAMKMVKVFRLSLVSLAYLGMLLPIQLFAAHSRQLGKEVNVSPTIRDVVLKADCLKGQVTNAQGRPIPKTLVVAIQDRKPVARAFTDRKGRYSLTGIEGGLCQVVAGNMVQVCRCWSHKTAPPAAGPQLLIASDNAVVRGQRPLSERVWAKPVLLGLVLAAAIAIPIAVHNSRGDSESGS